MFCAVNVIFTQSFKKVGLFSYRVFGRKDFMNFFAPSREKQPLRKSIDLDEPVELSKSIQM
jgi:hypothetical protein